jgi:hypothetical protein
MTKHKHYDLIVAWAAGNEIEYLNESDGRWYLASTPVWHGNNEYRIRDPYRELKEAAKDPNKEINLIKNKDGVTYEDNDWHSGDYWQFTEPPDWYVIRDKPKATKKVKMWQWILRGNSNQYFTTNSFYATEDDVARNLTSAVIKPAPWTEIEVAVDGSCHD